MAELVYALVLETSNFGYEGSSPSIRSNFISKIFKIRIMLPFTLQQLRILKAIATEENFTKAAEILYLSQPSLSKQIKTLEKNLDILLTNRL